MNQKKHAERESERREIALPCEQEHFAKFISGLLGKPQTVAKRRTGVFDLGFSEIASSYHLVDQRVKQQNAASLVQFSVTVFYDDGASIRHNSFEGFQSYNEVRPVSVTETLLSWTYLIKFPNNEAPEKQEIEVLFDTGRIPFFDSPEIPADIRMLPEGGGRANVAFCVKHTEWTWGADIEGRLSAHIETLLATEPQPKKWLRLHSGKIAFAFSVLAIIAGLVCIFLNMQRFFEHQATLFALGRDASVSATDTVIVKLDRIQESLATGAWYRFSMTSLLYAGATVLIAIVGGIVIGSVLDDKPPSFLRLSTQSEKQREFLLKKSRRQWLSFFGAFAVAVIASVVANYAYAYLASP